LADAKLGLGAPSMSVFAFEAKLGFLNLMALKHPLGHGADGTQNHIPKRVLGVPKPSASLRLSVTAIKLRGIALIYNNKPNNWGRFH